MESKVRVLQVKPFDEFIVTSSIVWLVCICVFHMNCFDWAQCALFGGGMCMCAWGRGEGGYVHQNISPSFSSQSSVLTSFEPSALTTNPYLSARTQAHSIISHTEGRVMSDMLFNLHNSLNRLSTVWDIAIFALCVLEYPYHANSHTDWNVAHSIFTWSLAQVVIIKMVN